MNEEWRPSVSGYEVSNAGRVRRCAKGRKTYIGRILKQQLLANGYFSVRPTENGRNVARYAHDMVAAAFIGPKPEGMHVNHIDGDKTNNRAGNLEYVTRKQNMRHAAQIGLMVRGEDHPASKLSESLVRQLRADRDDGLSFSKLAKKYGVSIATAFHVAKGNYWRHVT